MNLDELERRVADALSVPRDIAQLCLCDPLLLSDVLEMTTYAERQRALPEFRDCPWRVNPSEGRRRTALLTPLERLAYLTLGMMIVPPSKGGRLFVVGPDRHGRWALYKQEPPDDQEGAGVLPPDPRMIQYLTGDGWFWTDPEDIDDPSDVVYGNYVAFHPLYALLEVRRIEQSWQDEAPQPPRGTATDDEPIGPPEFQ